MKSDFILRETIATPASRDAKAAEAEAALVDLVEVFRGLDVFDLTKLVVACEWQKSITEVVARRERAGDLEFAQTWALAVVAAVESPSRKNTDPKRSLREALAAITEFCREKHAEELRKLLGAVFEKMVSELSIAVGEKIVNAARVLIGSTVTLIDEETLGVLIEAADAAERALFAAGVMKTRSPEDVLRERFTGKSASRPRSFAFKGMSSRAFMLEWGPFLLAETAAGKDTDTVVEEAVESCLVSIYKTGGKPRPSDDVAEPFKDLFRSAFGVAALWAASGFPQIVLTHKLAAALMATDPPGNLDLRAPWQAFVVLVPDGLIPPEDGKLTVETIGMSKTPDGKPFLWLGHRESPAIVVVPMGSDMKGDGQAGKTEMEKPSTTLLLRLLIGAVLEMDSQKSRSEVKARQKEVLAQAGKKGPPSAWTFKLGREVKVDCRQWVKDYVASGGTSPSVRSLVRGHHKHQPYGPKGALRKWIFIEPYWRGDLDGPVVVRPHLVG